MFLCITSLQVEPEGTNIPAGRPVSWKVAWYLQFLVGTHKSHARKNTMHAQMIVTGNMLQLIELCASTEAHHKQTTLLMQAQVILTQTFSAASNKNLPHSIFQSNVLKFVGMLTDGMHSRTLLFFFFPVLNNHVVRPSVVEL